MSPAAVALVLAAAGAHAAWNLFAKRAEGGPVFVWLCAVAGTVVWGPVAAAVVIADPGGIELGSLPRLCVTAGLHLAYYLALQESYRHVDLSVAYPIARGTGALLAVGGAVLVLGERPTSTSLIGAFLIAVGIIAISGPRQGRSLAANVAPAIATGAIISLYTVWDAYLVTDLHVPALLLVWAADVGQAAALAPLARRRRRDVARIWRSFRREVVGVAVLSPIAYVLVLFALRYAPLSFVAPAREVSILIGVLFGWRLLGEPDVKRRLVATVAVVAGMALATLG